MEESFTEKEKKNFLMKKYFKEHFLEFLIELIINVLVTSLIVKLCGGDNILLGIALITVYTFGKYLSDFHNYKKKYVNEETLSEKNNEGEL